MQKHHFPLQVSTYHFLLPFFFHKGSFLMLMLMLMPMTQRQVTHESDGLKGGLRRDLTDRLVLKLEKVFYLIFITNTSSIL